MGLLSLFQRKTPGTGATHAQPGDEVQRARSRARQRLIGAVVLVGIGIVGFPLLFETHPRPIPVDIPIEIANKDKAPPLVMPPARPNAASAAESPARRPAATAGVITESASEAGREVAPPAPNRAAPESTNAASAASAAAPKRQDAVAEAHPAKSDAVSKAPSTGRDEAARARAALEARAGGAAKDEVRAVADGRFVVQVGAFAEASTARETRQRVEKLGLKTYTQDVDTAAGRRIRVRVGPFGSRDEADRVVGKLKSAGLPAALLTL
jgi:DedD protein